MRSRCAIIGGFAASMPAFLASGRDNDADQMFFENLYERYAETLYLLECGRKGL
jgi:hypothetical protein